MPDFERMAIRATLTEYIKETDGKGVATRWDALNFCLGYYKILNHDHVDVINQMYYDGLLRA